MKKLYLILLMLPVFSSSFAQHFAWAQTWGSSSYDYAGTTAVDHNGNIFVSGYFRGTMDADPGPAVLNFTATGSDVYVSKFSPEGKLLWAKHIAGDSEEVVKSVAVDPQGNVYLSGYYQGLVDFDPGPGNFFLPGAYPGNSFICKLNANGGFVWAKHFKSIHSNVISAMVIDQDQNIYTTGRFSRLTDFDPGPGQAILDANNGSDIFVSKLNASGNFVWARQIAEVGDTGALIVNAIAVDPLGNVSITGYFNGTVDFDPGPGIVSYTSQGVPDDAEPGAEDLYVTKLDADGNYLWAGIFTGLPTGQGTAVASDEDLNTYAAGYFRGTFDFDPGPGVFELTATTQGASSYLCKYDPAGNLIWAKLFTGPGGAVLAQALHSVTGEGVLLTGYFGGSIDFDPGAGSFFLNSNGGMDIFLCKVDPDGELVWAQKSGGAGDESALSIAYYPQGEKIYTAGFFTGTADFDPSAAFWPAVASEWDCFLVKWGACIPSGSAQTAEACNKYAWTENNGLYTKTGIYHNILTGAEGCDSIVSLDLTVREFHTPIFLDDYVFTANPSEPVDSFFWVACDGNYTVLGTGQTFAPSTNGSFALISVSGECRDTTACVHVTGLGLDELEAAGLKVGPNPAGETVYIHGGDFLIGAEVRITDIKGRPADELRLEGPAFIDVSRYPAGIYLWKIRSRTGAESVQKIVIN